MFTKRRTPLSSSRRSLSPGNWPSSASMISRTVPAEAGTSSLPCVSVRSGVGMRTVTVMIGLLGSGVARGIEIARLSSAARTVFAARHARATQRAAQAVVVVQRAGGAHVAAREPQREQALERAEHADDGPEHARHRARL